MAANKTMVIDQFQNRLFNRARTPLTYERLDTDYLIPNIVEQKPLIKPTKNDTSKIQKGVFWNKTRLV